MIIVAVEGYCPIISQITVMGGLVVKVKAILLASINQQGKNLDGYDTSRMPEVEAEENAFFIRVPWPFVVRLGALYEALNVTAAEVSVDPARGGQQGVTLHQREGPGGLSENLSGPDCRLLCPSTPTPITPP